MLKDQPYVNALGFGKGCPTSDSWLTVVYSRIKRYSVNYLCRFVNRVEEKIHYRYQLNGLFVFKETDLAHV